MVWELHVWGPAFSLPSIDAQCLAAIAYFKQAVPKGQWLLVGSGDASLSPTRTLSAFFSSRGDESPSDAVRQTAEELPALRDGSTWIGGYRDIVDYVRQYSDGRWDLDARLDPRTRADCVAYAPPSRTCRRRAEAC